MTKAPRRSRVAALGLLGLLAACGGGGGGDAGRPSADVPVVITHPDYGLADPGKPADPGPTKDPGGIQDPGTGWDPGVVPEDPGAGDEDVGTPDPGQAGTDLGPADPGGTCTPYCAPGPKPCGGNGCGGLCGPVKCAGTNEQCIAQQCVCVPNCSGKVCGDDGCGGQCLPGCGSKACAPSGKCANPACDEKHMISTYRTCAENNTGSPPISPKLWGNTVGYQLDLYSPTCTDVPWWGQELVYKFKPAQSGRVDFTFSGDAGIRLFLLEDLGNGCLGTTCVASTTDTMSWDVVGNRLYYLVVDTAVPNQFGDFDFEFICSWQPPTADKS